MKIQVNKDKCLGCGMCMNICPAVFELKEGVVQVKEKADFAKNKKCIQEAIALCPNKVIQQVKDK